MPSSYLARADKMEVDRFFSAHSRMAPVDTSLGRTDTASDEELPVLKPRNPSDWRITVRKLNAAVEARLKTSNGRLSLKAADFVRSGTAILLESAQLASSAERLPPFKSAGGYFRREAYALIREHLNSLQTIKQLARYDMREKRQPTIENNVFYWGLLAVDPAHCAVKQADLSLTAMQMLYAHRHGVPPEHLIGFIYQCGSQSHIRKSVRCGLWEDDFLRLSARSKRTELIARRFSRG